MTRTITVKGVGEVSAAPDTVIIDMELTSSDMDYETAMGKSNARIDELTRTIVSLGFSESDLKTTHFSVDTNYESGRDPEGNYRRYFAGYEVHHNLRLSFPFTIEKLSAALDAVAKCSSEPEIHIRFTLKDISSAKDRMLENAAVNARHKAEVLCKASRAKLGSLLYIDYNWEEVDIYSPTSYERGELRMCASQAPSINPEDIEINDTVTFVWELCD